MRYPGVRTRPDNPLARRLAEALAALGGEPALVPTYGGSLPLHVFGEAAAAPILILPIANQDNNQHAPNENLRIGNLWYGIEAMAAVLTME